MVSISEVPGFSYTYRGGANETAEALSQGHAEDGEESKKKD